MSEYKRSEITRLLELRKTYDSKSAEYRVTTNLIMAFMESLRQGAIAKF